MDILNSMGGSMHPSWHFGELLKRDQYALGAAYECDLLRGAAEPKPFWITELQGGNNLYRPMYPMSPSDEDIAQFLWTIVGSGGKRVIYWKLDPSSAWSLLDFQGRPSERVETTRKVANVLRYHSDFFAGATPFDSPITLLISLESMTVQLATHGWKIEAEKDHIGRSKFAHLLSTLGYYKAFAEMGIPVNIKHVHDYDWEASGEEPRLAILANATAIAPGQTEQMEAFVKNGNTLIVSGLTGIYDPYRHFLPTDHFPLQKLFGGRYKEIRLPEIYGNIALSDPDVTLPYHLWVGEIEPFEAKALGTNDDHVIATHNVFGRGHVYWIPSLIGLPAFESDNAPLMQLLEAWAEPFIAASPFRFQTRCQDCVSRILVNGQQYVMTLTNGGTEKKECALVPAMTDLKATLIWGEPGQYSPLRNTLALGPRETVVLLWK
jgi:beta-galactosidase